jgi:hypothetical protein
LGDRTVFVQDTLVDQGKGNAGHLLPGETDRKEDRPAGRHSFRKEILGASLTRVPHGGNMRKKEKLVENDPGNQLPGASFLKEKIFKDVVLGIQLRSSCDLISSNPRFEITRFHVTEGSSIPRSKSSNVKDR